MFGSAWVYVAIAGLLCAHLLILLYAYRVNRSDSAFDAAPVEAATDAGAVDADDAAAGGDTVCQCPECGTENDPTYRFCRQCVAELPATHLHIEHPGRQQQPY
mgnify:CR=1 FL=1